MEGIILILGFIFGLIQLMMIIKFFEMATNISKMNAAIQKFTKYYYDLQQYKYPVPGQTVSNDPVIGKPVDITDTINTAELLNRPIEEKLTQVEYKALFQKQNDRFMDIANHFYKNDRAFYNEYILPVFEKQE